MTQYKHVLHTLIHQSQRLHMWVTYRVGRIKLHSVCIHVFIFKASNLNQLLMLNCVCVSQLFCWDKS